MEKEKKERVSYLDFLRIFAMVAVVLIHVAAENWYGAPADSYEWGVFNFYDGLARWAVPVFVMISGALMLGKDRSLKVLYKKNILRLVAVLFFWSLVYVLWQIFVMKQVENADQAFSNLLQGPPHLWFLFMITGLYMITPLLRKIVENPQMTKYFVILSLVFAFAVPQAIAIIKLKAPMHAATLTYMNSCLNMSFVMGYSGYYVLGYLLSRAELTKKLKLTIYVLGILGVMFTIAATAFVSVRKGQTEMFYNNITLNVLCASVAVFVFGKEHLPRLKEKGMKRLQFLAKCSLGIYVIHPMVLEGLSLMGLNTLSFNPALSVPVITLIVATISFVISIGLNKIPFVKKWLV